MATRTQIMNALLLQLQLNMPAIPPASFVRRFADYNSISGSAAMPYLMLTRVSETYGPRSSIQLPPRRTMEVMIDIYVAAPNQASNIIPDDAVCTIMDQLDSAFAPPIGSQVLTLGGLVDHCYIVGKVMEVPGDLDGIGVIRVPVEIVIP